MKYFSLLLCCALAFVTLSLPAMAANDDPYDGDSMYDIPTGSDEDPYNQNVEDPEPEVSEDPVPEVSETPDTSVEEEVTDVPETPVEEEVPSSDGDSSTGSSDSTDTGTQIPVVQIDQSSFPAVYNVIETETVSRSPLLDAVTALFGSYQPRTYMVTTYLDDGSVVESEEIVPGLAGLDYEWLTGAALFLMALYCIFRMIGGLSKWK